MSTPLGTISKIFHGRRPRVLQCITHLGLGGSEQVALSIIRLLRDQVDFGVFTVYGQTGDEVGQAMEAELRALGVPWFRGTKVTMKAGGPFPGGLALGRAVRHFRPDILHLHAEPTEACAAVWSLLHRAPARPVLLRTVHNSVFWRFWPRVGNWCDRRLARAHAACVSSAAQREFIRYRAESGAAAPADCSLIYNGVGLPPQTPRTGAADPTRRRLLFAGRLEYEKGLDILLAALPLVKVPPGCVGELRILGRGRLEENVRQLIAQPVSGWTISLEPPTSGLTEVFKEADVLVMPSRFEGLGLVSIEASLCGLPVVATDAPGLSETLPANHPWLARAEDAHDLALKITAALERTDLWPTSVAAAQALARERFAPQAMANAYARLYEQLISTA